MSCWRPYRGDPCAYPGLYAISLDGIISYIGQSENVGKRLIAHGLVKAMEAGAFKGVRFSTMSIKVRRYEGAARLGLELRMIKRLKPEANISGLPKKQHGRHDEIMGSPVSPVIGPCKDHWMHLQYG